jgi:hypothetical protein
MFRFATRVKRTGRDVGVFREEKRKNISLKKVK